MRHAAFSLNPAQRWSRVWGRHSPTRDRPCDRTFSRIENLWPQVDTCFRLFRATLKIPVSEPRSTLTRTQAQCAKHTGRPCSGHRSHRTQFLPLFCSGVFLWLAAFKAGHGTVALFGRLMKDSRCVHQNITQEIEIYFSDIIAQAR